MPSIFGALVSVFTIGDDIVVLLLITIAKVFIILTILTVE